MESRVPLNAIEKSLRAFWHMIAYLLHLLEKAGFTKVRSVREWILSPGFEEHIQRTAEQSQEEER